MIKGRQVQRCHTNTFVEVRNGGSSPRRGFTLIELLITLALMIVIITVYYGFSSPSHQKRQKRLCQDNLQKLYLALEIYATDHKNRFPDVPEAATAEEPLALLVPRYTADTSVFICPGSKDASVPAGESIRKRAISYAYYMGRRSVDSGAALISDRQVNTDPKDAGQLVFSSDGQPPGNNHHQFGGNFLFSDGRVDASGAKARFALAFPSHVRLLNPNKP